MLKKPANPLIRGVFYALFLTTLWSAVAPVLAVAAAPSCLDIFGLPDPKDDFFAEVSRISSVENSFIVLRDEAREQVRQHYLEAIDRFIKTATTPADLADRMLAIDELGKVDSIYQDALHAADLLAPIRKNRASFTHSDLDILQHRLEQFSLADTEHWAPTLEAFTILENPDYASVVIEEWILSRAPLQLDILSDGEYINFTLVASLAGLPPAERDAAALLLKDSTKAVEAWIKLNNMPHDQAVTEKEITRSWQMLLGILYRHDLANALALLKSSSAQGRADFSLLEKYLSLLHRHDSLYPLSKVYEVARAIQTGMQKVLANGDTVEIFGSFPNLSAKIGVSDVDVMFSPRLDLYYYTVRNRLVTEGLKESEPQETLDLLNALGSAGTSLQSLLSPAQPITEIISVHNFAKKNITTIKAIEVARPGLVKFMMLPSPVTIFITRDKIYLRIYDGLRAPGESPVTIYQYEFHP